MEKIKNFISNHISFKFDIATIASFITALTIAPAVLFLPEKCGFENGLIENIQLVVLFLGVFFALRPKADKQFSLLLL